MFDKVDVKGSAAHPLFAALKSMTRKEPDWNFAKCCGPPSPPFPTKTEACYDAHPGAGTL
jgi:hypothetical protein